MEAPLAQTGTQDSLLLAPFAVCVLRRRPHGNVYDWSRAEKSQPSLNVASADVEVHGRESVAADGRVHGAHVHYAASVLAFAGAFAAVGVGADVVVIAGQAPVVVDLLASAV